MEDQQPLKSPEARFMEQQLLEHGKNAGMEAEIDGLKKRLAAIDETFDTLTQTSGGKIALPYIEDRGGTGNAATPMGEVPINVFIDGTVATLIVNGRRGADEGPYA